MNLAKLKSILAENNCQKIYVKRLSPNDNSKNQVYLGGSFEILNILPISEIKTEEAGDWNKERFKAKLDFYWAGEDGQLYSAPNAQLILYPKYPEVRFSGFLSKSENAPSELMTQRLAGRLLFIAPTKDNKVVGFATFPDSDLAKEFENESTSEELGVFKVIDLPQTVNNKQRLLFELNRIHQLDWILSKRLDKSGNILPCVSSNCGGYTLEAELGITPNGFSEPDYLGWEVKQFGVDNFQRISTSVITLMTPEPTHGIYVEQGVEAFIRRYGYDDLVGREDRKNFGGVHKINEIHSRTKLKMELLGFDLSEGKIRNSNGMIALLDENQNIAASWSFSSMLLHWNRKHNQACYVPSLSIKVPEQKYKYGDQVILGEGTDFQLFLREMAIGNIYYDPGIKMENASIAPKIKRRSQFRMKSQFLGRLYKKHEIISLK